MKKSDPIMEELMFLIYQGRFPLMEKKRDDEELFHIKQSNSQSEWVIHAREIAHMAPYSRPSILQEIYDSNKATHWDNEDDFCCFQYVGFYEGKKIRVMFYNSVSREDHNSKIPYRDWIQGDRSYIRICLD